MRTTAPVSVAELLAGHHADAGDPTAHQPHPLGFDPLDKVLGGGLRPGDLALLGGPPGVGKTVVALQWARYLAAIGHTAVVVCYEHDQEILLQRLLVQTAAELAGPEEASALSAARAAALDVAHGGPPPAAAAGLLDRARDHLAQLGERLWLVRGSAAHTDLAALDATLEGAASPVLFVDYLQKVAVRPEPASEHERLVHIVGGLKETALTRHTPVVAVAACDQAALEGRRARLHHLRGSTSLAYEADVALMLNPKTAAVSEVHLAYDPVRAQSFTDMAVLSVEKNRSGPAMVDCEFRTELASFRLDPVGGFVAERMAD